MREQGIAEDYLVARNSRGRRLWYLVIGTILYAPLVTLTGGMLANSHSSSICEAWHSGLAIQAETNSISMVLGTLAVAVAAIGLISVDRKDARKIDGAELARLDKSRPVVYLMALGASTAVALAALSKVTRVEVESPFGILGALTNAEVIASGVVIISLALLVESSFATYERVEDIARVAKVALYRHRWEGLASRSGELIPSSVGSHAIAEVYRIKCQAAKPRVDSILHFGTFVAISIVGMCCLGAYLAGIAGVDVVAMSVVGVFGVIASIGAWSALSAFVAIFTVRGEARFSAIVASALIGFAPIAILAVLLLWPEGVGITRLYKIAVFGGVVITVVILMMRESWPPRRSRSRVRMRPTWKSRWRLSAASEIAGVLAKSPAEAWPAPKLGSSSSRKFMEEQDVWAYPARCNVAAKQ